MAIKKKIAAALYGGVAAVTAVVLWQNDVKPDSSDPFYEKMMALTINAGTALLWPGLLPVATVEALDSFTKWWQCRRH